MIKISNNNNKKSKTMTGGGAHISTNKKNWGKLISKLNAVRNTFRNQEELKKKAII